MRLTTVCLLCITPIIAFAHHSRSEFSQETKELEGVATEVIWRNPHPEFTISISDTDGGQADWRVQAFGAKTSLERSGVTGDVIKEGDRIRVFGRPSNRRSNYLLGMNVLLADNTEAVLARTIEQRWNVKSIGGRRAFLIGETGPIDAASESRGIFRVWSPNAEGLNNTYSLTESAIEAQALWDDLDNPLSRCEPIGVPTVFFTPQEFEFIDQGDYIQLRHQFYGVVRTIHMDDAANPEDQPASRLGHSVGRWEQSTLIVKTTRINWPYIDPIGTPQTEGVVVEERYTLSDDQSRLDIEYLISEPATFTGDGTHVVSKSAMALGRSIQEYDCHVF